MPKSELLDQILNDYVAANPSTASKPLEDFCVYVAGWLVEHPVIGVGMATTGTALRFADGREMSLVVNANAANPNTVTPPVNITGNSGSGITRGAQGDTPSVNITQG